MKSPTQWGYHEDVFGMVVEGLDAVAEEYNAEVTAHNEEDNYGDRGYIIIEIGDARYSLSLNKESH
jgi:hypothetical protein